jgi:putative ABC transport system permease protein
VQIVEGRSADAQDEVVLGAADMDAAGVRIGDQIVLEGARGTAEFRVVGRAVLHQLLSNGMELDHGAVVTPAGLAPLFSGGDVRVDDSDFGDGMILTHYLIDVADDVSPVDVGASLREHFRPTVISHLPPLDVASLDSTSSLPLAFAGLVSVLGGASLVHLLLATVRRRRSDFAVLATLGARPRQLGAVLASMASAIGLIAVVLGIPIGVILGRQAWLAVARGLGAPTGAQVSLLQLLVIVAVLVVAVNLVAAVPGRLATRVRPADALRVE